MKKESPEGSNQDTCLFYGRQKKAAIRNIGDEKFSTNIFWLFAGKGGK